MPRKSVRVSKTDASATSVVAAPAGVSATGLAGVHSVVANVVKVPSSASATASAGTAVAQPAAFDFYISVTGTGAAAFPGGSFADPWPISMLNDATARSRYQSKTVGLMDGTYGLITLMGQPPSGTSSRGSWRVGIAGGTDVAHPTIIKAVNARAAILDWQRSLHAPNACEGASMAPQGDYVTIDGLVFANNNYGAIDNGRNGGPGGNFLTIKNCLFKGQSFAYNADGGSNACAIYSQGYNDLLISNCRFQDGGAPGDANEGLRYSFIEAYQTTNRVTVEFCTFIYPTGNVPFANAIYGKQGYVKFMTVRYCYMDRSACTSHDSQTMNSLLQRDGDPTDSTDYLTVHNCIFVNGDGRPCMHTEGGSHGTYDFHNNTFIGPYTGNAAGTATWLDRGAPIQTNFYNNICHRVSGAAPEYGDMNHSSLATIGESDHNLFSAATPHIVWGPFNNNSRDGLAAWLTASGKDANSAVGTPVFTGTVIGGIEATAYQLTGGSPGKTLGLGGTEIGAWGGNPSRIGCDFPFVP